MSHHRHRGLNRLGLSYLGELRERTEVFTEIQGIKSSKKLKSPEEEPSVYISPTMGSKRSSYETALATGNMVRSQISMGVKAQRFLCSVQSCHSCSESFWLLIPEDLNPRINSDNKTYVIGWEYARTRHFKAIWSDQEVILWHTGHNLNNSSCSPFRGCSLYMTAFNAKMLLLHHHQTQLQPFPSMQGCVSSCPVMNWDHNHREPLLWVFIFPSPVTWSSISGI